LTPTDILVTLSPKQYENVGNLVRIMTLFEMLYK